MLVSPSDVITAFSAMNDYHLSWSQSFARHAEVRLIDYLSKLKRRPSEIGVSNYVVGPVMFVLKPLTKNSSKTVEDMYGQCQERTERTIRGREIQLVG